MISKNAIIYQGVKLGKDCVVEDFSIIGSLPKGYNMGEIETVIGDNAVIRSHSVIYAGNKIGNNFQTGNKANIREFNEIGDDVSIGTLSVIEHHVKIRDGARIHSQAFIPEYTILEEGCWIGPNAVITNSRYPNSPTSKQDLEGVRIKRHAIIGANSTILPGTTIGEHAIIGAGCVVTRDVPPYAIVAGNPGKVVNYTDRLPLSKIYNISNPK